MKLCLDHCLHVCFVYPKPLQLHAPPHLAYVVLGTEPRASRVPGKHATN